VQTLSLEVNMRTTGTRNAFLREWGLSVGDGTAQTNDDGDLIIPDQFLFKPEVRKSTRKVRKGTISKRHKRSTTGLRNVGKNSPREAQVLSTEEDYLHQLVSETIESIKHPEVTPTIESIPDAAVLAIYNEDVDRINNDIIQMLGAYRRVHTFTALNAFIVPKNMFGQTTLSELDMYETSGFLRGILGHQGVRRYRVKEFWPEEACGLGY
jgi:hypothetical protein